MYSRLVPFADVMLKLSRVAAFLVLVENSPEWSLVKGNEWLLDFLFLGSDRKSITTGSVTSPFFTSSK